MEVCSVCSLPKDLCVCQTLALDEQKITIKVVKRRFGKLATIVQGFDEKTIDGKDLSKKLKSKLACGGTFKNSAIELQGNHGDKVKAELIKLGFNEDSIVVSRFIASK
ncbi:MAG TPA: stress response translation initiation inhibitor YciH [Candidatus Nanoarchaeia archaeon]|nr:stress response translation initiation inhibitor YciH [Candidatus Nanoarchaeia archaeon]